MTMEATFERFDSYDFDTDANFQAGLKSILAKQHDKTEAEQKDAVESAKFFFFSRFVQAFDMNEYKAWKNSRSLSSEKESFATTTQEQASQDPAAVTSSHLSHIAAAPSSDPTYPKSFQEICELIASGKPIPGIRQIPNNLAEGAPSESRMTPKRKPWEKAPEVAQQQ